MCIRDRSMPVHNSIVLDEKAFCVPKDSWGYSDFGWPLKNYFTHIKNVHYLSLIHIWLKTLTKKFDN